MRYCPKCRTLSPDGAGRCQNCRSAKLRPPAGEDLVLLQRADLYTAEKLAERLTAAGLAFERAPVGRLGFSEVYDSEAMPTDQRFFVRWEDLPAAQEISCQTQEELDQDRPPAPAEESPSGKRLAVLILSTLAFLAAVVLVVLGTDAFANWLQSLLGW